MKLLIILFWGFIILFFPAALPAQLTPSASIKPLSQYMIKTWKIEQGLPQNTVKDIIQTPDGYLWVTTHEGIVRFNGNSFHVYSKKNVPNISNNSFNNMIVSRDSSLWVGNNGGGVYRIKNGKFQHFTQAKGLPNETVRSVYQTKEGSIWCATLGGGIGIIHPDSTITSLTKRDGLNSDFIYNFYEDESGQMWIGTSSGFNIYKDGKFIDHPLQNVLKNQFVITITGDRNGNIWLGGTLGAVIVRSDGYTLYNTANGLIHNNTNIIMPDSDGSVWIGTTGGLSRLANGVFENLKSADGLSHVNIFSIYEDNEKNIWVGTVNGLNRLNYRQIQSFSVVEGLSNDFARSVFEDSKERIWIGTDGGGITMIENGKTKYLTTANGLADNRIYSFFEDKEGTIWIGTTNGISLFQNGKLKSIRREDGFPGGVVMAMTMDHNGNVLTGTAAGGIYRHRNNSFEPVISPMPNKMNFIRSIFVDSLINIWVGTNGNGLSIINTKTNTFSQVPGFDSLAIVFSIFIDSKKEMWVGTNNGLYHFSNYTTFKKISSANGLHDDLVFQIAQDHNDYFWLTSNNGVSRIKRTALLDFVHQKTEQISVQAFDQSDGMRTVQCNGGSNPAIVLTHDNQIWIPTPEGMAIVNPNEIYGTNRPPVVHIEQVFVNRKSILNASDFSIEPGYHDIEIHYIGLNYRHAHRIEYVYQLSGYDTEWISAGTRKTAFYTNLAPGDYTFTVRAKLPQGDWQETKYPIRFYLEPHFYETRIFYTFSILLGLGTILLGHKMKTRKLKRHKRELEILVHDRTAKLEKEKEKAERAIIEAVTQRELAEQATEIIEQQNQKIIEMDRIKTQFFSNISHEFRTPLTLTIGPLEHTINGGFGPVSDNLRKQLQLMLRNSRLLLRLINQLLDISKIESGKMKLQTVEGNIVSFLKDLVSAFETYAEQRSITLQFNSEAENIQLYFDKDKTDKIFYNLISNAFKFTPEGGKISIDLTINKENSTIQLIVSDTGIGISEDEIDKIFERFSQSKNITVTGMSGSGIGLSMVKDFVELHGGAIRAESKNSNGAAFIIILPLGRDHLTNDQIMIESPHIADLMAVESLKQELAEIEHTALSGHHDKPNYTNHFEETILIADDNYDLRKYVKDILIGTYNIVEAINGKEALDLTRQHHPDLIISDVMMPVMNGYELCREIKADQELNHIPIILLTAKATGDMKIEGFESGANDYMYKPFYAKELIARVRSLIKLYRHEMEIKRINNKLSATNQQLTDANELKTELLNIAAHDLKNPLQGILSYTEMLSLQFENDENAMRRLMQISRSADRMLHQINELLETASIEAGSIKINAITFNLKDIVTKVVHDNLTLAEKKHQQLLLKSDSTTLVYGDPKWISESVENFISNAIKYSPLHLPINISLAKKNDRVVFSVQDQGPGLTSEDKRKVFGKFQRLSAKPTGGETSTGLGLSIVKQLIELHHGHVGVDSELGKGSTFYFELPLYHEES